MPLMLPRAAAPTLVVPSATTPQVRTLLSTVKTIDHIMALDLVLSNADEITAAPISLENLKNKKQGKHIRGEHLPGVMPDL